MSAEPLRVVLVDDHALCRNGLTDLLHHRGNITVVAALGDPDKVAAALREHQPDLLVLDLRMPSTDGLTLLRRLRAEGCDTPALILTMSDAEADLAAALRAGVRGYLLKDMEPEEVIAAIERAARGELTVAPAMTLKLAQMLQAGSKGSDRKDLLDSLTERERQILDHLARGESNKAIARTLDISHDTVKLHVRHILSKLNLSSRVEAAVFAVESRAAGEGRLCASDRRVQPLSACLQRHRATMAATRAGALAEPGQLVAQPHDLADDRQARRLQPFALHLVGQRGQRRADHALRPQGSLRHDGRRPVRRQAVRDQLRADRRQSPTGPCRSPPSGAAGRAPASRDRSCRP